MAHTVREWQHPRDYAGATWEGWYSAGFGQSRDTDTLEASNFQVAWDALRPLSNPDGISDDGEDGVTDIRIVREGHWAMGWVEWIAIHGSNTKALAVARKLCKRAKDYPVLDEDHWSNLEYTRAMEFWDSLSLSSKVDYCRDSSMIGVTERSFEVDVEHGGEVFNEDELT